MATRVVPLESKHKVKEFDCGDGDLNLFLRATASQHQRKLISKTYVLVDDAAPWKVMGFYTLAIRKMAMKDDLPLEISKRLPREVPGFSLARLAVRTDLKGHGYGGTLLFHALDRAARVADEIGGFALFVDAKDDVAAAFYSRYGFIAFPDDPLTLCLPFARIPKS